MVIIAETSRERTTTKDPQQSAILLPISEYAALYKPCCSAIMLSFACSIMIDRGIWGRKPRSKFVLQLVPCESV